MKKTLAAAVLFVSSLPVFAAPVTFQFTATVTSSSGQYGLAQVGVGDQISGSFTYDKDMTSDTNSWDVVGQYPFTSSSSSHHFRLVSSNSGEVLFDESGPLNQILVENNWSYPGYPTLDAFTVEGQFSKGSETFTFWLWQQNRDTNLDIITSDELLSPPPSFDQFNFTKGTLSSSWSLGQVYFDLTSVTPVPLPGSFFLMLGGLAFLVRLAKTRKGRCAGE